MATIGERVKECISESGLTKTAFAERINLSQPFVSQICSGAKTPSDRTILDICREFNVNETWLRTGEGEMLIQRTRDEEIASFVGGLLAGEDESFKRRFVSMLSKLDENGWAVLEQMAQGIVETKKKD